MDSLTGYAENAYRKWQKNVCEICRCLSNRFYRRELILLDILNDSCDTCKTLNCNATKVFSKTNLCKYLFPCFFLNDTLCMALYFAQNYFIVLSIILHTLKSKRLKKVPSNNIKRFSGYLEKSVCML